MESERKMFKFYKSYYDIAMELSDNDRLKFYDAVMKRQFTGIETDLTGIVKLAYISQKYNIDTQVKGWEEKMKMKLSDNHPMQGGVIPPVIQEEEKVKEKEKEEEKLKDIFLKIENTVWDKLKDNEKVERADLIKTEFKNSTEYQNILCRNYSLSNYELNEILIKFLNLLDVNDRFNDTFPELKKYFNNWINKNIDILKPKNILAR